MDGWPVPAGECDTSIAERVMRLVSVWCGRMIDPRGCLSLLVSK
jgi:hypothetical protein